MRNKVTLAKASLRRWRLKKKRKEIAIEYAQNKRIIDRYELLKKEQHILAKRFKSLDGQIKKLDQVLSNEEHPSKTPSLDT